MNYVAAVNEQHATAHIDAQGGTALASVTDAMPTDALAWIASVADCETFTSDFGDWYTYTFKGNLPARMASQARYAIRKLTGVKSGNMVGYEIEPGLTVSIKWGDTKSNNHRVQQFVCNDFRQALANGGA